jgi:hypothetical protein
MPAGAKLNPRSRRQAANKGRLRGQEAGIYSALFLADEMVNSP